MFLGVQEQESLSLDALVGSVSNGRAADDEAEAVSEESGEAGPESVVGKHGEALATLDEAVVADASGDVNDDGDGEDDEADGATGEAAVDARDLLGLWASALVLDGEQCARHARRPSDVNRGRFAILLAHYGNGRSEGRRALHLHVSSDIRQIHAHTVGKCLRRVRVGS